MSAGYPAPPAPPPFYQAGPGAPNPMMMPGPMSMPDKMYTDPQPQVSAAQVGEQYRAELFARCASGVHEPQRKYGVCGIITAIACFPLGLICLFTDSSMMCSRCGVRLESPPNH